MSQMLRITLSVVVGLVLAFSAYLLGVTFGSGQTQSKSTAQQVYVVTGGVSSGVTLGEAIQSGAIKTETYPAASLPSNALGPQNNMSTTNVAAKDLYNGQLLTTSQFVDKNTFERGTGQLPDETLVSLKLTVDEAVAGMLKPADVVSVYSTAADGSKTTLIVPRARVVLVGQSGASTSTAKPSDTAPVFVTLALTDAQTQTVIGASASSTIHLALLGK